MIQCDTCQFWLHARCDGPKVTQRSTARTARRTLATPRPISVCKSGGLVISLGAMGSTMRSSTNTRRAIQCTRVQTAAASGPRRSFSRCVTPVHVAASLL